MSQFVNYNSRSISLPAGCKDLIDTLRRHPQGLTSHGNSGASAFSGALPKCDLARDTLAEIHKYVDRLWKSPAQWSNLLVSPADPGIDFNVQLMHGHVVSVQVCITMGTALETAVRKFFDRRGFSMPDDLTIPKCFSAGLPVQIMCPISPVPSEAGALSQLAMDLFREICGFEDETELCYSQTEVSDPD